MTATIDEFPAPAPLHPADGEIPGERPADPAAPYGRKSDGTPRSKPGRKPGPSLTGTRRTSVRPAAPRPAGPPKPAAAKKASGPDYKRSVQGLLQLAATPLLVAAQRSDRAAADAAAISLHAEPIAQAVHDLATDDPRVGALLERLLAVGPYGALIAAVLPLGMQLAVNHGVAPLPLASALGAQDPRGLVQQLRAEMAAAAGAPAPAA